MQFKDFDPDQLATYTPEADGKMVGAMSVLILNSAEVAADLRHLPGRHPHPDRSVSGDLHDRRRRPRRPPSPPGPRHRRPSPPSTTTTLSDFIPQAPEGEACG